jgi:hypothetical protein
MREIKEVLRQKGVGRSHRAIAASLAIDIIAPNFD